MTLTPPVLDFGPNGTAPSEQNAYLTSLNDAQRTAVTAEQDVVIILAGPGSGKTRTLTSRVVDLIVRRKVDPFNVAVVTFTNKAANEMKHRIQALLGEAAVNRLNIGTFHAVCAKILRTRAAKVGLSQGFAILDRTDSENYIKRALASTDVKRAIEAARDYTKRTPADYLSFISKGKAKNSNPDREAQLLAQTAKNNWNRNPSVDDPRITVYREYERLLRANNALDFDDLLIYGLKAIEQCPDLAQRMHHVLVDEFQDTNTIQLDITNALCSVHKRLTIVGDPDQSIYAWRSADVTNLKRIQATYPDHLPVYLEENYRSVPSILTAAHEVISQDRSRVKKKLFTTLSGGHTITVHKAQSPETEAAFVANEIQRLINITEGQVDYGDVAILVRTAYQTRVLEDAFVQKRIPHVIVGGMRFYERAEIKDVLAYLRLVDNPGDASAFERAMQVPPRGIGQASVEKMIEAGNSLGITPMEVARRLTKKVSVPGVSRIRVEPLKAFVGVVDDLCGMLEDTAMTVDRLMLRLVDKIQFQKHLQAIDAKESTTRWENVEELINTAGMFRATGNLREEADEEDDNVDTDPTHADTEFDETVTPSALLTEYLQSVSLSSDLSETLANAAPSSSQGGTVRPVTKAVICTMHASKGLEWPVVFMFATDQIPHPRSETPEARAEERRLLYVGMTRAQRLLYMSYPEFRFSNWNGTQKCSFSPFADCLFERSGHPKSFNGAPVVSFTQPAQLDETTMDFFAKLRESKMSSVSPEAARQLKVTHVPGGRAGPKTAGVKRTASAASLTGVSSSQVRGFQSAASMITSSAAQPAAAAVKGKAKAGTTTRKTAAAKAETATGADPKKAATKKKAAPKSRAKAWMPGPEAKAAMAASAAKAALLAGVSTSVATAPTSATHATSQSVSTPTVVATQGTKKAAAAATTATKANKQVASASAAAALAAATPAASVQAPSPPMSTPAPTAAAQPTPAPNVTPAPQHVPAAQGQAIHGVVRASIAPPAPVATAAHTAPPAGSIPAGATPMPMPYAHQHPHAAVNAVQSYAQQMYYAAAMAAAAGSGVAQYGSAQYPGCVPYPYGPYPPSVATYMAQSQVAGSAVPPPRPAVVAMQPAGSTTSATGLSAAVNEPPNKKARTSGSVPQVAQGYQPQQRLAGVSLVDAANVNHAGQAGDRRKYGS